MPSQDSAPEDDDVRHTYNFAPGNYGLVYRADVPDYGAGPAPHQAVDDGEKDMSAGKHDETKGAGEGTKSTEAAASQTQEGEPQYRLQAMKWGTPPPRSSTKSTDQAHLKHPQVSYPSGRSATRTTAR